MQLQCHYWTPEQISGWLQHRQTELPSVCSETMYAWIYKAQQKKEKLWKFLPRHKSKRGLRKSVHAEVSCIPNRVSLHERPKVFGNKRHFGHWEADLMSFRKNSQHMLMARERKTMFTFASQLPTKRAVDTSEILINFMNKLPKKARKTITYDNGGRIFCS